MKLFVALLSFLCLVQLSTAQKKNLPIKVIEATLLKWVSGAPGGRTGTKYTIKVYIHTNKKVEFKNIWIGKENAPFDVEFFSLDIPKKIQQGDSLLLTYNTINGERIENSESKGVPICYKGSALFETAIDGKTRYFIVKNFRKLPPLRGQ
ncbi:MAG: hypothetical protein V4615_10165 [Bacteroidota bacterium]